MTLLWRLLAIALTAHVAHIACMPDETTTTAIPTATPSSQVAAVTATTQTTTTTAIPITRKAAIEPKIEVLPLQLSAAELQELLALDEAIAQQGVAGTALPQATPLDAQGSDAGQTGTMTAAAAAAVAPPRMPRHMSGGDSKQQRAAAAAALTDAEITEIVKMISFPRDDDAISEDHEAYPVLQSTEGPPAAAAASTEAVIEPRHKSALLHQQIRKRRQGEGDSDSGSGSGNGSETHATAMQRSGRGYFILAFSPAEGPSLPYTKLDIIPAERAANAIGDEAQGDGAQDDEEDNEDTWQPGEPRLISRRQWNSYIRRMMRQIRRGTRQIQRRTTQHVKQPKGGKAKSKTSKASKTKSKQADAEDDNKTEKSAAAETPVTVETFLRRMYATASKEKQKQQASSWFEW